MAYIPLPWVFWVVQSIRVPMSLQVWQLGPLLLEAADACLGHKSCIDCFFNLTHQGCVGLGWICFPLWRAKMIGYLGISDIFPVDSGWFSPQWEHWWLSHWVKFGYEYTE